MKIRITYLPEEDAVAQGLTAIIRSFFSSCRVKKDDSEDKYKHIYVSIKSRESKK